MENTKTPQYAALKMIVEQSLSGLGQMDFDFITMVLDTKGVYSNIYKLFLNKQFIKNVEQNQQ